MKRSLLAIGYLSMLFLAVIGCSENEDNKDIVLTNGTQTMQTVYADQTTGDAGGIHFTAAANWTASVTEMSVQTRNGGSSVDWLTLSAYSGGAGEYTLAMTISENQTGQDRKAKIEIRCGADVIVITVEQKGTTEGGGTPVPVPQGNRISRAEYTSITSTNSDYYSKMILTFAYNGEGKLSEIHDITYYGDEKAYYSDAVYTFTYEDNRMGFVLSNEPDSYTALLNEAGYVSVLYRNPTDSYSTTVEAWFFNYNANGYLQQITGNNNYEPGGNGSNEGEDEVINPGHTRAGSDRVVLNLVWKDGNLMSTRGGDELDKADWMEWDYTSYLNETPGLDFNVLSARNLFGMHDMTYGSVVNMLYSLRMLGKNSKNLLKNDLVNWAYSSGESEVIGTKATTTHEDVWAPYEYTFTAHNYLDVVTARCTLKTYTDGELINTTYIDNEYRFAYE